MSDIKGRARTHWRLIASAPAGIGLLLVVLLLATGSHAPDSVTLRISAAPAGTVSPSGIVTVARGSTITVTARPPEGWTAGLMSDDAAIPGSANPDGTWAFLVPADADHVVAATFARLAPAARLVDAASAAGLTRPAPDQLLFTADTALVAAITPGMVLVNEAGVSGTPIMDVVTAVSHEAGRTVVTTRPAALTEVVTDASVALALPLESPRIAALRRMTASLALDPMAISADVGASLSLDATVASGPCGDAQVATCSLEASGKLTVKAGAEMNWDIDLFGGKVNMFETAVSADFDASASIAAAKALQAEGSIHITTFTYTPIIAMVGIVPVVITPGIDFGIGGEASIGGEIKVGVDLASHFRAGFHYEHDAWTPIAERTVTVDGNLDAAVVGEVSAWVMPRPTINIEGACTTSIELRVPKVTFTANTADDPWWTVDAGGSIHGVTEECLMLPKASLDVEAEVSRTILDAGGPFPAPTDEAADPSEDASAQPLASETPAPSDLPLASDAPTDDPSADPGAGTDPAAGGLWHDGKPHWACMGVVYPSAGGGVAAGQDDFCVLAINGDPTLSTTKGLLWSQQPDDVKHAICADVAWEDPMTTALRSTPPTEDDIAQCIVALDGDYMTP